MRPSACSSHDGRRIHLLAPLVLPFGLEGQRKDFALPIRLTRAAGLLTVAAVFGASAPAHADETNYAKLGRWSVTAVTNGANLAYCSADIDNGKVQLRLTTDGKSWRVGVPYYESRKKIQGYYGFGDAAEVASFSVTSDGWAFIAIDEDQVNAFKGNPAFSINLDRGLQTWKLAGAGPALDKAGECARNGGRSQQARAPTVPPPAANPPVPAPSRQGQRQAGRLVLPDFRNTSTCMIAQYPAKGARLVVGQGEECNGQNGQFVLGQDNIVQLAQAPNLCIASNDRANDAAFVGECANSSLLVYDRDRRTIGAIAGEALCLGLKGRPNEAQIVPGQVFISETCAKAADQTISFQTGASAQPQQQAPAQPIPGGAGGLSAASFRPITSADLSSWTSASGCSFSLSRGKDLLAIFDTQDSKKTALFKIDGKLTYVRANAGGAPGAYWAGIVAGNSLRLIKGKLDPKFRNDGGGQGGDGRLEWSGPDGQGGLSLRWEEGC